MSVIVITGCSSGIGYATAEKLALQGHIVYATLRNPRNSSKLQELAKNYAGTFHILQMDVLKDDEVNEAFELVLKNEGGIDVLINNAGVHSWGAVEETPLDTFQLQMDTNYFGALRCIKAVLPDMREKRSGLIINNTSIAGQVYSNFHGAYAASKAALEALSESLYQELVPFNVRVAIVQAAFIETPVFRKTNIIPANTAYPNSKRFLAMFAATLEYHFPATLVADVIADIVDGKNTALRATAGPYAEGFIQFRTGQTGENWVNSVSVSDESWIQGMEQMGLKVGKYMNAEAMPQFTS